MFWRKRYFAVSEYNCGTDQEIPGLKSVARCSDAILGRMHTCACDAYGLLVHLAHTLCFSHLHGQQFPFLQTIHNYKENKILPHKENRCGVHKDKINRHKSSVHIYPNYSREL